MIRLDTLPLDAAQMPSALRDTPAPHCLTMGVFDGLHIAHQQLIRRVVKQARDRKGTALVLTFSNHPLSVLAPPYTPGMLLEPDRKANAIAAMGVDVLLMPTFTTELAGIEPGDFLEEVLKETLRVKSLVAGFDFRFGRDGTGTVNSLPEKAPTHGIEVDILPAIYQDERPVSSTHVRDLIESGRVRAAAEMLGRPHELSGPVVHGYGRGTNLGYPTANVEFDPAYCVPPSGVYAVLVQALGQIWKGMMNIGYSPTFVGTEYRPEVFLFDFEKADLYDQRVRIHFVDRVREERKFDSARSLQERLKVDDTIARAMLESIETPAIIPEGKEPPCS